MKKSSVIILLICIIFVFLFSKSEITLVKAHQLYNSNAWPDIGSVDMINSEELLKNYKYKESTYKNRDCYIFDIKDSKLKLYSFLMPECDFKYLFQMVLVSVDLLGRTDVFEIGNNLSTVKEIYSDIFLFENDHIYFEFDNIDYDSDEFSGTVKYYFEILNYNGLYSYGIDENEDIVIKYKFDFETMQWSK